MCAMQHCSRMGACVCVCYATLLTDGCVCAYVCVCSTAHRWVCVRMCVMQHCSRMGVCVHVCLCYAALLTEGCVCAYVCVMHYAALLTDGCMYVCALCSTAHGWVRPYVVPLAVAAERCVPSA